MLLLVSTLSIVGIVAGGCLAAFSARKPTRFTSWLSAYLVLVVGIIQYGLVSGWGQLGTQAATTAACAFTLYDLGNIAVIYGTAIKSRSHVSPYLVNGGGILLATSMGLLAWTVRHATPSWTLGWFLSLALVVLITMTIGMILAGRHRTRLSA